MSAQSTSESAHECRNCLQRERRAKQREQPSFHNDALQLFRDGDVLAQGTSKSAQERRNHLQKKRRAKQHEQPFFRNDALQLFANTDALARDDGIVEKWTQYVDSAARKCGSKNDWQTQRTTTHNFLCYENGKILLPNLPATPQELKVLLTSKKSSVVKF